MLELQDALAKSTESGAALETALRAHQSMSESAPLAPSAAAEQVHHAELPARRGEVAELRRQLSLLEDARRHDQRMLLVAEERAQAVVSTAAVREALSSLPSCLARPALTPVVRRITAGSFKS